MFWKIPIFVYKLLRLDIDRPVVDVSNLSPVEGSDVTLTCNVSTTDTIVRYTWYFGNTTLVQQNGMESKNVTEDGKGPEDMGDMQYHLSGGNRSNSGDYSCKVETSNNLVGTSDPVTVRFLCKY